MFGANKLKIIAVELHTKDENVKNYIRTQKDTKSASGREN